MLDQEKKNAIIERIVQSHEFRSAQNYQDLLTYISSESFKGESPKETSIAIDVLGRGADFNPATDTIVRYYMLQLRKKLDVYYSNEGKEDPWRLVIPKGHYRIEFRSRKTVQNSAKSSRPVLILLITLFLVSSGIAVYFYWDSFRIKKSYDLVTAGNPVWKDFLSTSMATNLVLGDYFLFREYRPELDRYQEIRDWTVEKPADLNNYQQAMPTLDIFRPEFTMLPHHTPENLLALVPLFTFHNIPIKAIRCSDLTWEDLKNKNLVYSGKFSNLGKLESLVKNLSIRYGWVENKIYILGEEQDTIRTFERFRSAGARDLRDTDYYNRDYALVAKVPTLENTTALIIAGFGHISLIEAVDLLTHNKRIKPLLDSLETINDDQFYFEMLLEVTGYKRTGLESRVQYLKPISSDPFLSKLNQKTLFQAGN